MTTSKLQVRRATIEDLPKLLPLWQRENLPWEELEKRFKEFQVVEAADGELVGVLGLEIAGVQGRVHSEVFAHAEQSDALRDLLWERAQMLAKNYGLVRLWTQMATPFWNHSGFRLATSDVVTQLPSAFSGGVQPWQFLQLREAASPISFEKEFAVFKAMEKERTQRLFQQAKVLKLFAATLLMVVFALLIFWVLAWFKARSHLSR